MTLRKGYPVQNVAPNADDMRAIMGAIMGHNPATGAVSPGILWPTSLSLATGLPSMSVRIGAFAAVTNRDGGAVFIVNDGPVDIALDAAPTSNSRIDLICVRYSDDSSFVTTPDPVSAPVFYIHKGVASAFPVQNPASLPAGTLPLIAVQISSAATTTQSNVSISVVAPYANTHRGVGFAVSAAAQNAFSEPGSMTFRADTQRPYALSSGIHKSLGFQRENGLVPITPSNVVLDQGSFTINSGGEVSYFNAGFARFDNVFDSRFDRYLLQYDIQATSLCSLNGRLAPTAAPAVPDIGASAYDREAFFAQSNGTTASGAVSDSFPLSVVQGLQFNGSVELRRPYGQLPTPIFGTGMTTGQGIGIGLVGGVHNNVNSMSGLQIFFSLGGKAQYAYVRIFGYSRGIDY